MPPKEKPKEDTMDFSLKETSPDIGGRKSLTTISNDKLTLVEQRHFLYVRIVRANLNPVDDPETCFLHRPFVELRIGCHRAATRVLEDPTHNPEWNQVFAFAKDAGRLQGNLLKILVKDATSQGKIHGLEDGNGQRVAGELMAAVWIGNQSDDAFSVAWHSGDGDSVAHTRAKVYHSPRLWYLRIQLIGAQDLSIPDINNRRRPEIHVKAVLGQMVLKSRIISPDRNPTTTTTTLNPSEELVFVAAEPFDDPLILIVEDRAIGFNIGRSVLDLDRLERRILPVPATGEKWINIERVEAGNDEKKGAVKLCGRLHLRVFLDGVYHVFDEPTNYCSDLRATSPKLWPEKIGTLELGILKAQGLVPMKSKEGGRASTDAYCVAKYGPKWVRTSTVLDSFAPNWNEQYSWDVYDPCTVITIAVFDNSQLGNTNDNNKNKNKTTAPSDSRIGKVRIRLSTLETNRIYTLSYPLIVLQPNGVRKTGELHLAVKFNCNSVANLLQTYAQPLFPRMHYINPLSFYQMDGLRHQAAYILSSRLGRADPPLNKDVVEYVLDSVVNLWSLRKGKANLHRFMACFSFLSRIYRAFDWIKGWNNPSVTLSFYVLFLILVHFPGLILPCVFMTLFLACVSGYPRRPRHPPHMDIKMSHAEDAGFDVLDEEFDTFPTSRQGEVVRNRYDRMRGIGGRVMLMVGDVATQMERVHSLFGWRDPRATILFLVVCLVCCAVVYICPVRYLVVFGGSYAIRPPRMRVAAVPSLLHNFLRRLPSNADCML
ncbi:unnamed protein product [Linum tenue]|uniref:C2 domain-containing protein n=1 Tax=Linum tenue TaxID=586396 RepID=A0AAV0JJB2_9ROSI|nr:unnamed protein product [Linum tenue]